MNRTEHASRSRSDSHGRASLQVLEQLRDVCTNWRTVRGGRSRTVALIVSSRKPLKYARLATNIPAASVVVNSSGSNPCS